MTAVKPSGGRGTTPSSTPAAPAIASERPGGRPRLLVAVTHAMSCSLLRGQLAYARERGFDVALLCSPGELATQTAVREGALLLPVPMHRKWTPVRDMVALMKICVQLRRFRPHIVNAGTPKAGFLVTIAAWICGAPCRVYTLRGLYLETASGLRLLLLGLAERLTCRFAGRVICVSPSLRARAVGQRLVGPEKAIVLGKGSSNGIDLDRFTRTPLLHDQGRRIRKAAGIGSDDLVIGFVGRIVPDKGVLDLISCWRELRRECPTVHLLMVGAFEDDRTSATLRAMLEADSRVHLQGEVRDLPQHYMAMDVVVLPTYREGLPNVLLETAAMALPVVATRVTGCIDVIEDGLTGTLVPVRDGAALAEAVRRYIGDPQLRARHGRAARDRVARNYSCRLVWENLCAEYDRLLRIEGVPRATGIADALSGDRACTGAASERHPDRGGGMALPTLALLDHAKAGWRRRADR